MHGTGTALGDPIEIGAAFAVAGTSRLGDYARCWRECSVFTGMDASETCKSIWAQLFSQHAAGLSLTAAKSRMGHAETAAGALGIACAVRSLSSADRAPVPHLASFNPYVRSILDAAAKEGTAACIPRQVRPALASSSAAYPRLRYEKHDLEACLRHACLPIGTGAPTDLQRRGVRLRCEQFCLPGHQCPCHPGCSAVNAFHQQYR